MPKKDDILNLPYLTIKAVKGLNPILMDIECHQKGVCIHCGSGRLRKKDSFIRQIRHESIGLKQTTLRIKTHKYQCKECKRYYNQRLPGVRPYQRATERLKEQVFIQHTQGISQQDLARTFKLGKGTVERWYHQYYERHGKEFKQKYCPVVLGIDEHFFNKRQGYATTLCDLEGHKIFDVIPGRSKRDLGSYLSALKHRERVKVVCMDLSSTYKEIVKTYFPGAKIVADRFHVIRLVNQFAMQTYQSLDERIKYNRGMLGSLRAKPETLSAKRLEKLEAYLKEQPAIALVYEFKQKLHQLLMVKHRNQWQCLKLAPKFLAMIKQLKESPFKGLKTLGKTLYQWREEIVRMWRFTRNNGITEGFHRKMKLIQRRAYGFKNFENYRLRVKVLCS